MDGPDQLQRARPRTGKNKSRVFWGAVLLIDGQCYFTHYAPPEHLVAKFKRRRDNQIMGLELLSISLGFSTFEELLRGRKVVVHSDNTGSEASRSLLSCCVA